MSAPRWPNNRQDKGALGNQHLYAPLCRPRNTTKPNQTKVGPRKLSCGQVVTLWHDGQVSNKA